MGGISFACKGRDVTTEILLKKRVIWLGCCKSGAFTWFDSPAILATVVLSVCVMSRGSTGRGSPDRLSLEPHEDMKAINTESQQDDYILIRTWKLITFF